MDRMKIKDVRDALVGKRVTEELMSITGQTKTSFIVAKVELSVLKSGVILSRPDILSDDSVIYVPWESLPDLIENGECRQEFNGDGWHEEMNISIADVDDEDNIYNEIYEPVFRN